MKVIAVVFLCVLGLSVWGGNYVEEMEAVIAKEDVASNFAEVKAAADAFGELSRKYPKKWEAYYWAAFTYSQCWVFSDRAKDEGHYIDYAMEYYQKALDVHPNRNAVDESEYQILNALLHTLKGAYLKRQGNFEAAAPSEEKSNAAFILAEKANADNPRVHMRRSIRMFHTPGKRDEGIEAMKAALKVYDSYELPTSISPNWGKSFIIFRLEHMKKD